MGEAAGVAIQRKAKDVFIGPRVEVVCVSRIKLIQQHLRDGARTYRWRQAFRGSFPSFTKIRVVLFVAGEQF